MKVSLVIHEDVVLSAVAGVIDMLEEVNRMRRANGDPPAFKVELISERIKNIQLQVPAQFLCYAATDDVTESDLIIVPSFRSDHQSIIKKNAAIIEWIAKMHKKGTEVASLCVGSFFLAEAGLLNGKEATSHWTVVDEMKRAYPLIKIRPDRVITDQHGIYTSGGAFSSLRLILYLIEKFCGRETAVWISKMFSIDFEITNQSHFAVFGGQHRHDDKEILKSQLYIEQNFAKDISIADLPALSNTGRRNFSRRFKAATGNTPLEYLQKVKIEAAKKALEDKDQNIDQAMQISGYSDIKTFRLIFKRVTGLSPTGYRKKYSRASTSI